MSANNKRTEVFSKLKMERIKDLLQTYIDEGQPRYFEIEVNNFPVVSKTDDINRFDNYLNHLYDDTEKVTVRIYNTMLSNHSKEVSLFIDTQQKSEGTALMGLESINDKVEEKLNAERQAWEMEKLKDQHRMKVEELDAKNNYIERLEKEVLELRSTKGKLTGESIGYAIGSFIRTNPGIIQKIPFIGALGGIFGADTSTVEGTEQATQQTAQQAQSNSESDASFTSATEQQSLSEDDQQWMLLVKDFQKGFTEPQLKKVYAIVKTLQVKQQYIDDILALITDQSNMKVAA